MKLNNYSFIHKKIIRACKQIELLSDMTLVTDLAEEFDEVRFVSKLGYIVIDYRRNAIYTLGHKLDKIEMELAQDIILYCDCLETGKKIAEQLRRN